MPPKIISSISGFSSPAATKAASGKAEEVQNIIGAWSDDPADLERNPANTDLLVKVRSSKTLQMVAKYLGRFREIIAQGRRNGYAYGRGEKYSLELGNDLSRALSSEFAMLASPQTAPLFLKKYQQKAVPPPGACSQRPRRYHLLPGRVRFHQRRSCRLGQSRGDGSVGHCRR